MIAHTLHVKAQQPASLNICSLHLCSLMKQCSSRASGSGGSSAVVEALNRIPFLKVRLLCENASTHTFRPTPWL